MGLLVKFGLGIAVIALAVWWGMPPEVATGTETGAVSVETEARSTSMSLGAELGLASEAVSSSRAEAGAGVALADEPDPADVSLGRVRLHGRVALPDGSPAAGVPMGVENLRASGMKKTEFGTTTDIRPEFVEPEDWVGPVTVTADDGSFELRLDPPVGCEFDVVAAPDGLYQETWTIRPPEGEAVEDFGVVYLRGEGSLVGRVVDEVGEPTGVDWEVSAFSNGGQRGRPSDDPEHAGDVDMATGAFAIDGLPEGLVDLVASSSSGAQLMLEQVPIRAGEVTTRELVFKGPDPTRTITVGYWPETYFILRADPAAIRVQGQGYDSATDTSGKQDGFEFHDLEPGLYTVTIDDKHLELFTKNGVAPGEKVQAFPSAASGARLVVTDSSTGHPVGAVHVRVRLDDYPHVHPNVFELHGLGPLPEGGLLPPLVPGNSTLLVDAPGFSELEIQLSGLARGEVRDVAGELAVGASIAGLVRGTSGSPSPGTHVLLMPSGVRPALPQTSIFGAEGYAAPIEAGVTDEAGRFVFAGLDAGAYDLFAAGTPWLLAESLGLDLAEGEVRTVDLSLPGGAGLEVHIEGLGEKTHARYALFVRPEGEARLDNRYADRNGPLATAAGLIFASEDGVWRATDLPLGAARLELYGVRSIERFGIPSWVPVGRAELLGDVELRGGETAQAAFDLAARMPGIVRVELRIDDRPIANARVELVSMGEKLSLGALELMTSRSIGMTDSSGHAVIEGVFPGTYRASHRLEDYSVATSEVSVVLAAGGEVDLVLEHHAVAGELRLLDQDGQPLERFNTVMASAVYERDVQFDDNGTAETSLAPGKYEATPWRQPGLVWRFTWPEEPSGVVEARLESLESPME
jgi:hypothetical protein